MNGERQILPVHVGNQVRHADRRLQARVRKIAPQPDGVGASFTGSSSRSDPDVAPRRLPSVVTNTIVTITSNVRAAFVASSVGWLIDLWSSVLHPGVSKAACFHWQFTGPETLR